MKLTVFLFFDFQRSQKTVTLNQQTLILCQKICYSKKKKNNFVDVWFCSVLFCLTLSVYDYEENSIR